LSVEVLALWNTTNRVQYTVWYITHCPKDATRGIFNLRRWIHEDPYSKLMLRIDLGIDTHAFGLSMVYVWAIAIVIQEPVDRFLLVSIKKLYSGTFKLL